MSSPRIPLILGAGLIGFPGTHARVEDPAVAQKFIDVMVKHGQIGIDTAHGYCEGTSEKLLRTLDLRGVARIDTKVYPITPGDHAPDKLKATFKLSLEALGPHKIRVFYLHAPDRSVPFEDTLEAVNDLHKAGYFEELGISNYMAFEVAEIVGICKRRGFVQPTIYEGIYNLLDRIPEAELFPCLRKFGIKFAAYCTLAGGYLTGKHLPPPTDAQSGDKPSSPEHGSHFDTSWNMSWFFTSRYPKMAPAVTELQSVVKAHGLTLSEVAYRWLQWHSLMVPGDHGVILGASRLEQLENGIADCEKGPLPEDVVKACDETWLKVRGVASNYWL